MKKILINFAHPALSRSKINKKLLFAIKDLPNITINNLYDNYPDFIINVEREQKLCKKHDIIIFQHPFYWYSTPSIIQEWCGLVLEHGWAYGAHGHALKNKFILHAISTGGEDSTYSPQGSNIYTIDELLSPFKAMAKLCRLNYLPPFMVMGMHRGLSDSKIKEYTEDYRRMLIALRDETIDIQKASKSKYINSDLDSLILQ